MTRMIFINQCYVRSVPSQLPAMTGEAAMNAASKERKIVLVFIVVGIWFWNLERGWLSVIIIVFGRMMMMMILLLHVLYCTLRWNDFQKHLITV